MSFLRILHHGPVRIKKPHICPIWGQSDPGHPGMAPKDVNGVSLSLFNISFSRSDLKDKFFKIRFHRSVFQGSFQMSVSQDEYIFCTSSSMGQSDQGCQIWHQNLVRLAPNLEPFKICFGIQTVTEKNRPGHFCDKIKTN